MGIAITVTFPCSDSEWNQLVSIRAIMGQKQMPIVETLNENESQVLNAIASVEDETPTLDFLEAHGVAKFSVSASSMMRAYIDENPSTTCKDAIKAIVSKYPNASKSSLTQTFYTYRNKTEKRNPSVSLRSIVKTYMLQYPYLSCKNILSRILENHPEANIQSISVYYYQLRDNAEVIAAREKKTAAIYSQGKYHREDEPAQAL